MIPIIVCTVGNKSLLVMEQSAKIYAPNNPVFVYHNKPSTFGEAYNAAMQSAFQTYDEIIIANDDVVLTPDTMPVLMEDVENIKQVHERIGFVATYSDNARQIQDIRCTKPLLKQVDRLSPYFAWISRQAFQTAQFPPINWYSDDVICEDLNAYGYVHFVSRAYVHHAGSQTVGVDYDKLNNEALPWVYKNRPDYIKKWF
jgi:GT2 family glycosyltransferase